MKNQTKSSEICTARAKSGAGCGSQHESRISEWDIRSLVWRYVDIKPGIIGSDIGAQKSGKLNKREG